MTAALHADSSCAEARPWACSGPTSTCPPAGSPCAGHGSSFTTLTTYAHVIAGDHERTAARAAGLFGD